MAIKRERLEDAIETVEKTRDKSKSHLFQKGHGRQGGRKPGTPNKMTMQLKEAILMAAELEGSNQKGREGVVGYLRVLARREPAVYGRLLEKILPYQLTGKDGGPIQMQHTTKEEVVERFKERGLPLPPSLMDMPVHGSKDQPN